MFSEKETSPNGKDLLPMGSQSFPFREEPFFQKDLCVQETTRNYKNYRPPTHHENTHIKFEPLKPYFYTVKLGCTGVYIKYHISAKNRLWVLVRTDSPRRFYQVPTNYVLSRNMKTTRIFHRRHLPTLHQRLITSSEASVQTGWMRRLVFSFVVHIPLELI